MNQPYKKEKKKQKKTNLISLCICYKDSQFDFVNARAAI